MSPRLDPSAADHLAALSRERGLPMTPQRRAIFEILAARHDHPTAEEVFEDVRRRLPDVSRTTVYRTLDLLVGLGAAARVHRLGWAARFDAHVDPHDHAVCVRCGSMEDLPASGDAHPAARPGADLSARGYEVLSETTQVHVVCPACRGRGAPARDSRTHPKNGGSS